jgi:hypothetical protein
MLIPGIVMYATAMVGAAGWWLVRGLRAHETDEGGSNGVKVDADTVR